MEESRSVPKSTAANFARLLTASDRAYAPLTSWRFDCSAILRSARHAISLRLLSIHVVALTPGYLIYLLFAYLSLVMAGQSLTAAWTRWGLLPCWFAVEWPHTISTGVAFGLGVLGWCAIFLLANTAGSRLLWMKSRGNLAYSIREAFDFAFEKFGAVILAPIAVVIVIVLFGSTGVLVGLAGKIPYIGQLLVASLAWLWLLAALAALLALVIAVLALALAPVVAAITEEGGLDALLQIAGIVWSRPWRLLFYLAGVMATAFSGLLVVAFCVKRAFLIMAALFAMVMGSEYQNISTQAQYLLQSWSVPLVKLPASAPTVSSLFFFSRALAPLALSPWLDVLAHIFALSLLFAAVWIVAYPLAIINSGLTQAYLALRRHKDGEKAMTGENFLERYQVDESTAP